MLRRWAREARLSIARIPPNFPGAAKVPPSPAHTIRDIWPGNPDLGALLITGRFRFDNRIHDLNIQDWEQPGLPPAARDWLQGFTWLRDLRALGSDEARLCARALVGSWLDQPPIDPLVLNAPATGARVAAWLGHYDFFAASADEAFRQRLLDRILMEGRLIAALLPLQAQGWRALTALKGLLAAAVAIPSQTGFMARFLRYLDQELQRLILPDGCLVERSPEAQFQAARELAEMSAIMRMAQMVPAEMIVLALSRVCPVLRAMRHMDGGLALFNGASEHGQIEIETVLQQGARQRLLAPAMPDGGFWRLAPGRSVLFVDGGVPAPAGFDRMAHAGPLSFEFSHARQRLFVNCGSAHTGRWEQVLRQTAAHTSLVIEGQSCCDFAAGGGLSRRPAHVTVSHQTQDGSHWLDMAHDGYHASLGARWQRRLFLSADGLDLRGQDVVEGEREMALALRFHLHPTVEASLSPDGDEVLMHAGGMIWRFRQEGGVLNVEDSVYFGGESPTKTLQIVVTAPRSPDPEPAAVLSEETSAEELPEKADMPTETVESETVSDDAREEAHVASPPKQEAVQPPPAYSGKQLIQWVMERVPE